ncbi:type II toxin-antitoxin system toxin ribonuclease C4 [soil metagenome]
MTQGLADTSFFLAQEAGRPVRRDALPERLAVSVVTIGELRAGVLSAADVETRDRRLVTLTIAMALEPRPVDGRVAEAWARLRMILRRDNLRMPINDSWIAATAMSLGVPVVTQDQDFVEVAGLSVVHV